MISGVDVHVRTVTSRAIRARTEVQNRRQGDLGKFGAVTTKRHGHVKTAGPKISNNRDKYLKSNDFGYGQWNALISGVDGEKDMAALTGMYGAESDQRMSLRHAVMLGTHGEQRRALRLLTTAPAIIFLEDERHIGLVRDLSSTGLFVYSDFSPTPGTELKMTIRISREKNKSTLFLCTGKVVRIENSHNGAAVGIGLKFEGKGLTEAL